jgi:hypothetical protein
MAWEEAVRVGAPTADGQNWPFSAWSRAAEAKKHGSTVYPAAVLVYALTAREPIMEIRV